MGGSRGPSGKRQMRTISGRPEAELPTPSGRRSVLDPWRSLSTTADILAQARVNTRSTARMKTRTWHVPCGDPLGSYGPVPS